MKIIGYATRIPLAVQPIGQLSSWRKYSFSWSYSQSCFFCDILSADFLSAAVCIIYFPGNGYLPRNREDTLTSMENNQQNKD